MHGLAPRIFRILLVFRSVLLDNVYHASTFRADQFMSGRNAPRSKNGMSFEIVTQSSS